MTYSNGERGMAGLAAHHRCGRRPQTADAAAASTRPAWSSLVFRSVLFVGVLGLIAAGFTQWATAKGNGTEPTQTAQDGHEPDLPDVARPAPILVEGGTLATGHRSVQMPANPSFAGDDDFLDGLYSNAQRPVRPDESPDPTTHVVYARPQDPFKGPIVGLELPASGGFRPWGANVTQEELTDFARQVEDVDGMWSIREDSGLIAVAEIQSDDAIDLFLNCWQFTFDIDGDREVALQAEPVDTDDQQWVWLMRMADAYDDSGVGPIPTIRPIEVLGTSGYVIETARHSGDDVIWASEGYLYRMMASHLEDDTSIAESASGEIPRLRFADRAEWENAIAASLRPSPLGWIGPALTAGLRIASGLSAIYFAIKRSFRSAAIAVLTFLAFYATASMPPEPVTVVMAAVGITAAWWLHLRPTPEGDVG